MAEYLVKQTKKLSGAQKAAILLSELGPDCLNQILETKVLKDTNLIHKLNVAYKTISNKVNVYDEISVLKEALSYGIFHKITNVPQSMLAPRNYGAKLEFVEPEQCPIDANPKDIAMVLRTFLNGQQ